jgi:hypothetical protein
MHPNQRAGLHQQQRVRRHVSNSDSYAFFNVLTGPQLLGQVESLLPAHRERLFPPTETLSMFLAQAMSVDRSCQQAVDEAAIKRLTGGLPLCSTIRALTAGRGSACRWRWSPRWRVTRPV